MPSHPVINLERLPARPSEQYLWADYIELLCLVNLDRAVSELDVIDRIEDRRDLGEGVDDAGDRSERHTSRTGYEDRTILYVSDCFSLLRYRYYAFKDFYPFFLSKGGDTLLRRKKLTLKQKLYVFFLLSANLKHVSKQYIPIFTASFEIASAEALHSYLPRGAKVFLFGKNPLNMGRYSGKLWYKIQVLAQDIRESVVADEGEFEPNDTGDNGLDIVGWVPFGDPADKFLIVFGQCACTLDWVVKQHSSGEAAWSGVISSKTPRNNVSFVPFCLRDLGGGWYRSRDAQGTILIDRLRLVRLLEGKYRSLKELPYDLVDEAVEQSESLF